MIFQYTKSYCTLWWEKIVYFLWISLFLEEGKWPALFMICLAVLTLASVAGSRGSRLPQGVKGPLLGDSWHCSNWPLQPMFHQFKGTEYVFCDISCCILLSVAENGINEYLNCGDSFSLFYQLSSYQRLLQQLRKKEDAVKEDWCFSMMALPTCICQLFSSVSKALSVIVNARCYPSMKQLEEFLCIVFTKTIKMITLD